VTGGAGYIGSHAAKLLASEGHEVVVLDNLDTGHEWAVKWGPLVVGDIGDRGIVHSILKTYKPDAVIHFAAHAYVGESMQRPEKYFRNNVAGTLNLLEALVSDGPRPFIFSSSCATYGLPTRIPITEEEPQNPVNPYGETKLMVEKVLAWYGELHQLPWVALRYFNAAGADPGGEVGEVHDPETHLIPKAIAAAQGTTGPIGIFGSDYETPDGTAIRDYIHVTDLADAHLQAAEHLNSGGTSTSLNLGTGAGHSVSEVVRLVGDVAKRTVPTQMESRRHGDPPMLVADPSAAQTTLGWKPKLSDLKTIVSTAWEWANRNQQPQSAANN
jgi:UDP-glucose-4-epimerase GalE